MSTLTETLSPLEGATKDLAATGHTRTTGWRNYTCMSLAP